MDPKKLCNKRIKRQQEILNAAKSGQRELTADERAELDELQREIDLLQQVIEGTDGQAAEGRRTADDAQQTPEPGQMEQTRDEETARCLEIMELGRAFDMDIQKYIENKTSVEQVRSDIIRKLVEEKGPVNTRGTADVTVTRDEQDTFRERAADALMLRAGVNLENPAEGSNELRAMSLRDLAIECLHREGQDASALLRMDSSEMYGQLCRQFYNPTAAFPAILDNTIKKSIVSLYNQVPTTFQAWTTKGSVKDFKPTPDYEYVIGGAGAFLKVPENGELKADIPRTEKLPSRKIDTYGRSFSMSRQAFINDDIGFLTEVPGLYAASARKTIDKAVYTTLYQNEKAFDGIALFDEKHSNLIKTGAKPSQKTIQEIILQMQKQTDQFDEAIYITPQYIIVPVGYEFDLAVILHSAQVPGSANNDINPLYNYPIQVIQTPVLNALAGSGAAPWFMVANQASARSIQVDYLNGQETPTVRRMETPGVLGFTWDIYLDWGIAVRDFRGIAKNPGEKVA